MCRREKKHKQTLVVICKSCLHANSSNRLLAVQLLCGFVSFRVFLFSTISKATEPSS